MVKVVHKLDKQYPQVVRRLKKALDDCRSVITYPSKRIRKCTKLTKQQGRPLRYEH